MKNHQIGLLLFLCSLCCFWSCQDDEVSSEVSVFTEEVVFTSGERAIMTGRVLSQGVIAVDDHGFEISQNENFTGITTIALGEKDIPGRFVGETNQLEIDLPYYCRSYIVRGGETTYGNVLQFNTLNPKIIDFNPKFGNGGATIIIEGRNFTEDTKVFWNNNLVSDVTITAETFLEFRAPVIGDVALATIRVEVDGVDFIFDEQYEYIIGDWQNEGPVDDMLKNIGHVLLETETQVIYGNGKTSAFDGLNPVFNVMDKSDFSLTQFTHPGVPTEGAFFTDVYFGGGSLFRVRNSDPQLVNSSTFWKYENGGLVQLANIPIPLFSAVAHKVGGKIYVYGGETEFRDFNTTIYVYDIALDIWDTLGQSPITPFSYYPSFHLDGENYFITDDGKINRHRVSDNSWRSAAKYINTVRRDGISVGLNGKGYVGLQDTERRIFEYTPGKNSWKAKNSIKDIDPFVSLGAWVDDNKIYVMRVNLGSGSTRVIWSFDPESF